MMIRQSRRVQKADEIGRAVFKDKLEAVLMAFTVILSVVFAVGLFMLIPYFVSRLLTPYVSSQFLLNFIRGSCESCLIYFIHTGNFTDEGY